MLILPYIFLFFSFMIDSASHISVQGQGSVHVEPDVMRLEIEVSDYFKTYQEAYQQGQDNKDWIDRILKDFYEIRNLAKTIDFDLVETRNSKDSDQKYEGGSLRYKLNQKIRLDLPIDEEKNSSIIRQIGENIPGVKIIIGFTLSNMQKTQLLLLEKAVSDASVKAKVMAEAAGCSLGRVAQINYKMEQPDIYRRVRTIHTNEEARSSTPRGLEINPIDFIISDTVEVTWHLK